jgi:hemoglobin-like flavoprotein
MLTNRQIDLVRRSFERIAPQAGEFSGDFYNALFGLQPALRLLFPDDLAAQEKKLIDMLAAAVTLLGDPEKLTPVLEEAGRRHALYGVRERHYEPVGAAFLQALQAALGAAFDAETAAAWARVYGLMSTAMIRGARTLRNADDETAGGLGH